MRRIRYLLMCLCLCLALSSCVSLCRHRVCEWVVLYEPTYREEGIRALRCEKCGRDLELQSIEKKICGHEDVTWVTDTEPTVTGKGARHSVCDTCGETLKTEELPALGYTREELERMLAPSVVKVYVYDFDGESVVKQGSGFFIDSSGTFLTNAHVAEDGYYMAVETSEGELFPVEEILAYDYETSDYAVCRAAGVTPVPVSFCPGADSGERVLTFGFPNDASSVQANEGELLGSYTDDSGSHYFISDAWIDHGSSGGALVNRFGEVIGMVTAVTEEGTGTALKYADLEPVIAACPAEGRSTEGYFHEVTVVSPDDGEISACFDFGLRDLRIEGDTISYELVAALKEEYGKVHWEGPVTVNAAVEVTFTFGRSDPEGGSEESADTFTVCRSLTFGDFSSLYSGVSQTFAEGVTRSRDAYSSLRVNVKVTGGAGGEGLMKVYE